MRSLPLFLLAVCLPSTIMAAGRHALILCNQNYTAVGALKTPLAEAKAAEETLKTLGFAGNITVVTDASTAKMTEVVDTFTSKLKDAEVALFFYGGHAIQAAGENYLLGVDSDPATTSQLAYKALPLGRVLTNLEGSGARLNLLILDCCRDNPLPTRGRNIGSTRGLAPTANAPKGTFIAYAADANQQAWDDHGQIGLYGSVLFEKMKTPGLRLEDIFIQTREEVAKIATEKYQHQQEPAEYSKVSGAFYFQSSPAIVATVPVTPTPVVTSSSPPSPALPPRGYFDLNEVFDGTSYDAYNSYSRAQILSKAQEKLKAAGLYHGALDGAMGPGTQQAILAWQRQQKSLVTGKLDMTSQTGLAIANLPESNAPSAPIRTNQTKPKSNRTIVPSQPRRGRTDQDILFGN